MNPGAPSRRAGRAALCAATALFAAFPVAASVFLRGGSVPAAQHTQETGPSKAAKPSAGGTAVAEWPFGSDIPAAFPLVPSFAAKEERGGFAVAAGSHAGGVRAAADALRAALVSGGWTPAAPTENSDGASFWTKGRAVALASATPAASGDGCVWLVARREMK